MCLTWYVLCINYSNFLTLILSQIKVFFQANKENVYAEKVLNSKHPSVVASACLELEFHLRVILCFVIKLCVFFVVHKASLTVNDIPLFLTSC